MEDNLSNENLNNEENSNNSNADNNLNQPTDNVDNNNMANFRKISGFFLDHFGFVPIVSGLIYMYLYIVAYSKSLYYNIPIKYFYSNSEMVKPIIYIVCIFLIILPHLKNLKYKIIEENLTIIRILSILASFVILFELCTYTIGNPEDISEETAALFVSMIKFSVAIVIVCLYAKQYYDKLKNESEEERRVYIVIPVVFIVFSIVLCLTDKNFSFQFLPIITMSILVLFHCAVKLKMIKLLPLIITIMLLIFFSLLLFNLNNIITNIATNIAYRSDYEVIEISTEENTEKSTKGSTEKNTTVIITEYNDSFIVMYGNIEDNELTIYNKFDFVDKNELNGHISHQNFKNVYIKDK